MRLHLLNGNILWQKLIEFIQNVVEKMGYDVKVEVSYREERKLGIYSAPVFTGILNVEADFSDIVLPDYPSHVYHPEDEDGIRWNDPTIAVKWPDFDSEPLLSEKYRSIVLHPLVKMIYSIDNDTIYIHDFWNTLRDPNYLISRIH